MRIHKSGTIEEFVADMKSYGISVTIDDKKGDMANGQQILRESIGGFPAEPETEEE